MRRRSARQWLDLYAETHRNPTNKLIHYICVPLILWSVLAILWSLPFPEFATAPSFLNWATMFSILALIFYLSLGVKFFLGMLIVAGVALAICSSMMEAGLPLAMIAILVFVAAWIAQFYGHKLEGKKPAFFDDLAFLLIGPMWILNKALFSKD